jgi:hypothetical protein
MSNTQCMKSELNLFQGVMLQSNVLDCIEVSARPLASLDNLTTLEFNFLAHPDCYKDLSSTALRLKLQITKADGSNYINTDTVQPGVTNNILHSLFRQCSVYFNSKLACTINNYHYLSYITQLLSYNKDAVGSHMGELLGFDLDDPSQFDSPETNLAAKRRKGWFKNSSTVELLGRVHGGIFNVARFLPSSIDIRIVFTLEKNEFILTEPESGTSKIKITDASLYMNQMTIHPQILIAHSRILSQKNAILPFKHVDVKAFTIPANNNTISIENLILGKLPTFLVIAFVDSDAFNGKRSKNPYNFKNLNMTSFTLFVNEQAVPNETIEMDFSQEPPLSARAYYTLFKGLNINDDDRGLQISQKHFNHGAFMLAYDLTADKSNNLGCSSLLSQGNIRLHARLGVPLTNTTTCIVLSQYESILEIDSTHTTYRSL